MIISINIIIHITQSAPSRVTLLFPLRAPWFACFCFLYFTSCFISPSLICLALFTDPSHDIICTRASVFVHVQVVTMATRAVVPSDVVVTELGAAVVGVLTFVKVWGNESKVRCRNAGHTRQLKGINKLWGNMLFTLLVGCISWSLCFSSTSSCDRFVGVETWNWEMLLLS